MKRRDFLRLTATTPLYTAAPMAFAGIGETASDWRIFELTYEVDLSNQKGAGHLWLPLPQSAGDYQRILSVTWNGQAQNPALDWDQQYASPIFSAEWKESDTSRQVTVSARVATRNRDMNRPGRMRDIEEAALYLKPTLHMPIDGIVGETARRIVKNAHSPDAKAKAIYEWIVDNTFREPTIRGCGMGNIKFMLESGNLGGKCADINSLFVGLARAAGIPAREMYGVRVADSKQFKSLGKSDDISKAQHCRAEFFSQRYGWVPVDPADVRKAVLEEKLALDDPQIKALRKHQFGHWEMNWVGFNFARDFDLVPKAREPVPYLMYPYAEFGDITLDGRDPKDFNFTLKSREIIT